MLCSFVGDEVAWFWFHRPSVDEVRDGIDRDSANDQYVEGL